MEQAERRKSTVTREEWQAASKPLAEPLDIEALIHQGLVTKAADGWYVVHNMDALPPSASGRIIEISTGWRVKFQA